MKHTTTKISDVANYVIAFFQEREDPITHLKLQKLLYYIQGWHLGILGSPAFEENFQAWIHGPVAPSIYEKYKSNKWNPIIEPVDEVHLHGDLKEITDIVLEVFGGDTGWSLEMRTHSESPWIEARGGIPADESSTNVITQNSMLQFFKKLSENGEKK
ncbi:MAG: DUF4065 domain-containing protein [Burkholderiales bacterium]|nr:DUF4065 domain-containing protein [Burkholderiales bacterium]